MTRATNRKTGKKGHGESAKNSTSKQSAKTPKKHPQYQQETSQKWIIGVGVLCLLIGAVAVVLYFVPSLQVDFKGKVSREKDFEQQKKVVKERVKGDGVDGRKDKKKPAGETRERVANASDFSASVIKCHTNSMKRKSCH